MSKGQTNGQGKPSREPNAWLVQGGERADLFSITFPVGPTLAKAIEEGDAVAVITENESEIAAVLFARIYRVRQGLEATTLYFDALLPVEPPCEMTGLGFTPANALITRVDWTTYIAALRTATGKTFSDLRPLEGKTVGEQAYLRRLLQLAVMDDLLGPANGPHEEVIGMSVRDRYLVGKLAPKTVGQAQAPTPLDVIEPSATKNIPPAEQLHPYAGRNEPGAEFNSAEGGPDPDENEQQPNEVSASQSLVPHSLGLTFCIDGEADGVELEVRWGRYERGESANEISEKTGKPVRAWKRIPSGGKQKLLLKQGALEPFSIDPAYPEVLVQGTVRPKQPKGDRLVTLFVVNNQPKPEESQDAAWVFQPEIIVRGIENGAVFRRRPVMDADGHDPEREALEMVYRKRVEFAVGHGVSVHVQIAEGNPENAVEVRTAVMPETEVQVTETPGLDPRDRPAMRKLVKEEYLDMDRLAKLSRAELITVLNVLTDDFGLWIVAQAARIPGEFAGYDAAANEAVSRCMAVSRRLIEGIKALEKNDDALAAFRFANRAMARQRVRSMYSLKRRRGEKVTVDDLDMAENRSWRPFQLAFILLSIPALADPTHTDRTEPLQAHADLLWFPTGGGKTEAYLGVAAFTMAIRRRQGKLGGYDASRGLAVIMRYTLRLLTIQQFQRATTLLCAMEMLRAEDDKTWGKEPFSLGLWVGNKVTPGTTEQSHKVIEDERDGKRGSSSTPAQLTFCPWCGSEIMPGRDIHVDREAGRTSIRCSNVVEPCEFSSAKRQMGLPVVVVDEEIYHRPPTMLIGTVDKFAMMAWRGETRTLFGRASRECSRHGLLWPGAACTGDHNKRGAFLQTTTLVVPPLRPPDLIIQDEFHLISGPLGTMVGLYETAIDELCGWNLDGKTVRSKIIASTATVRKAEEQVKHVFLRKVAIFPPHGLDIEDNFFSVQRPVQEKPGRLYLGICSPGSSRPAVLIRLYVALLTAAQSLFDRFGNPADPYMTLVGYFNSLRELGGMRRLAEDDVQTRAYRVQMSRVRRPGLNQRSVRLVDELTGRVSSKEVPKKLDHLEVKFKKVWAKNEARAMDVVLATNMLSVGVDVNRLGLMVVNGQPKSTAEYIQATSRVGRSFPGLVCTVLTWSRPRDLSHYETFEHYHDTFYKHVEAQSVTPFAPRAMDRGLTGAMVSLLRLSDEALNPNLGAEKLDSTTRPEVQAAKTAISDRAWKVTNKASVKSSSDGMLADRIDRWVKEATKRGRQLGYTTVRGQGNIFALLKKPSIQRWEELTVPMSMREVEPGVNLIMDTATLEEGPFLAGFRRDSGGGTKMSNIPVGEVRPSQLLWTYGPGALVDLPNLSVITMGLDRWDEARCMPIEEARLLYAVKRVLGHQVEGLRMPPIQIEEKLNPFSSEAHIGVPVRPFPRWLRCVRCGLLAEYDSGLFTIKENPYRPEDTRFVHKVCDKGSDSDAVPARFLLACRNGHLDDFPWRWFVHQGYSVCKGTLRFFEQGASLQTENLWVKCDGCNASRSLVHAFGREAEENLPACRGRHPHLNSFDDCCKEKPRAVLLGSTNSWFSISLSVLAIPQGKDQLAQLLADGWTYFADLESEAEVKVVLKTLIKTGNLPGIEAFSAEQVWKAVEARLNGTEEEAPQEADIKRPEWRVLTNPIAPNDWPHFLTAKTEVPPDVADVLESVLLLPRLREVNALIGFTRVEAPEESDNPDERPPMASLCRSKPKWVPAFEVHGEGIFIRFKEDVIHRWEALVPVNKRDEMLRAGHCGWRNSRQLDPGKGYPGVRYAMLHTFSHLLIRELALECGYNAASIRERIYSDSNPQDPMAGLLLYTSAADSDGTLGGLVDLGKPENLGRLIKQAMRRATICSSDPLCSEHNASTDRSLHGASCHACGFVSETSCERGNRYLDRALLVPTFDCANAAIFSVEFCG